MKGAAALLSLAGGGKAGGIDFVYVLSPLRLRGAAWGPLFGICGAVRETRTVPKTYRKPTKSMFSSSLGNCGGSRKTPGGPPGAFQGSHVECRIFDFSIGFYFMNRNVLESLSLQERRTDKQPESTQETRK